MIGGATLSSTVCCHHPFNGSLLLTWLAAPDTRLQGKAEVVQRALEVQSLPGALPVQLVQPAGGKLTWVLDQGSAASLTVPDWALGSKVRKVAVGIGSARLHTLRWLSGAARSGSDAVDCPLAPSPPALCTPVSWLPAEVPPL